MSDFVADGYDGGECALCGEVAKSGAGVVAEGGDKLVAVEVFPCGWFRLLAGVGPGIAVVEGEHEAEAGFFDAESEGLCMLDVTVTLRAIAALGAGVVEEAEADIVEAVVAEYLKYVFCDAAIAPNAAADRAVGVFILGDPGYICAENV